MKLLFDQNLSFKLCRALEDLFPRAVWRYAGTRGYVLVTLDADFVELATVLVRRQR